MQNITPLELLYYEYLQLHNHSRVGSTCATCESYDMNAMWQQHRTLASSSRWVL